MENELDFGRYSSAFRRHRRLIAGAIVLGVAAGLLWGVRSPLVSAVTFTPVDRSAQLKASGISPELVNLEQIVGRVASELESDGFKDSLGDGVSVDVTIVNPQSPPPGLGLTASARSEAALDRALDQAMATASEVYADELANLLDGVVANYQDQLDSGRSRLDSIAEQASSTSADQTTLAEGLLVSAERARAGIAELEDQIVALQRLSAGLASDLRMAGRGDAEQARSPIMMGVLGGLAAAVVVLVALAVMTAFDRRIRTRSDLERIGLTDLLGAVSTDPESDVEILAGALRQATKRTGTKLVQLVPVTQSAAVELAGLIARVGGIDEVVDRAPLAVDPAATMGATPEALTIVKVAWGKDTRNETMSVVNRLAAAASAPIGVVLVDVPRSEIAYVER